MSAAGSDQGVTLEGYARDKHLPVEFLRELGLETRRADGRPPALKIPYHDAHGEVAATRYRTAEGFRWERGTTPLPYGLDRLAEREPADPVILVEGESDAHTLWHAGLSALGIPGTATWRREWAQHVAGRRVYAWQEPDRAGETFVRKLAADLSEVLIVQPPDGVKDPSTLYLADPDRFRRTVADLLLAAKSAADLLQEPDPETALREAILAVLGEVDPRPELDAAVGDLESAPSAEAVTRCTQLLGRLQATIRPAEHSPLAQLAEIGVWDEVRPAWARGYDAIASDRDVTRIHGAASSLGVRKPTIRDAAEREAARLQEALAPVAYAFAQALQDTLNARATASTEPDPEIRQAAETVLEESDILARMVEDTTRLGHRGEEANRKVVLLAGVAGHTAGSHEDAIHLVAKGDSSAGKNELVRRVLGLLPTSRVRFLTGVSQQGLVYAGGEIDGVLVFQEAEGEQDAEYMVRQAMSEGWLERLTVQDGASHVVRTYVKGSIITTTTAVALHEENQTRVFDLHMDTSEDLTREVVRAVAARYAGEALPAEELARIRTVWRTALGMLEPAPVVIPFAGRIADRFPTRRVRARRDFARTLNLVRACALLHQRSRERDDEERVVAEVADYAMVRPLLQAILGPSMSGLTDKARAIVAVHAELASQAIGGAGFVPRADLQREVEARGLATAKTVKSWCRKLTDGGAWEERREAGRLQYRAIRDVVEEPIDLPRPEDLGDGGDPA